MSQGLGLRHDIGAFLGAVFRGWVLYRTGGAVGAIVGTYLAFSSPSAKTVFVSAGLVFSTALVAGVFQAWRIEYRRRCELEGIPQLRLHFVPGEAPYEQDHTSRDADGDVSHYFRVGVTHDGPGQVEDVRVLLAALEPQPSGFPLLHSLAPMGEPAGTSSCALASGSEPTRFFDVLIQVRHVFIVSDHQNPSPTPMVMEIRPLTVCFTAGDKPGVGRPLSVRLVVEGRNAKSAELRFDMTYTPPGLLLELRPAADQGAM